MPIGIIIINATVIAMAAPPMLAPDVAGASLRPMKCTAAPNNPKTIIPDDDTLIP